MCEFEQKIRWICFTKIHPASLCFGVWTLLIPKHAAPPTPEFVNECLSVELYLRFVCRLQSKSAFYKMDLADAGDVYLRCERYGRDVPLVAHTAFAHCSLLTRGTGVSHFYFYTIFLVQ